MKLDKLTLIAIGIIVAGMAAYILITVFPNISSLRTQNNEASVTNKNYIVYNGSSIGDIKNDRVVYFFNALWCPTCQEAVKNFKKDIQSIPKDLTLVSIDYDKYPELKLKYGVTIQHTFIQVDTNLNSVKKANGLNQISQLNSTFTEVYKNSSSISSSGVPVDVNKISGTYTTYSGGNLSALINENTVLFFKAEWCPTCKATHKNINSNLSNIPTNMTIIAIDYDSYPELKRTYGVITQHTFVKITNQQDIIRKTVGLNTLNEIIAFSN
jgi:thiol-disulfide isomerase/thioredoxin